MSYTVRSTKGRSTAPNARPRSRDARPRSRDARPDFFWGPPKKITKIPVGGPRKKVGGPPKKKCTFFWGTPNFFRGPPGPLRGPGVPDFHDFDLSEVEKQSILHFFAANFLLRRKFSRKNVKCLFRWGNYEFSRLTRSKNLI